LGKGLQLDVNSAIESFISNFEGLRNLPFIDDAELISLYGPQVAAALDHLEVYNLKNQICNNCKKRCCLLVKCELYDADLGHCVVQPFRPALCRLHFCKEYEAENGQLVKELGDIYLETILAAAKIDRRKSDYFDCPSFMPLIPELTQKIRAYINSVKAGRITESQGLALIHTMLQQPERSS
jgi:hypothetical protein